MDSAVHSQKIFHCPTITSGNGINTEVKDREFSTMSGLVQHIENQACKMGGEAMSTVIGVIGPPMRKFKASITPREK
jgi:hypothetical protein